MIGIQIVVAMLISLLIRVFYQDSPLTTADAQMAVYVGACVGTILVCIKKLWEIRKSAR